MADTVEIDIIARVDKAVSGIQDFITKIGAAYVSVEAFKRIVVDSFKSYEEAENSQVRLGQALRATGQYSRDAHEALLKYSEGLMKTSIFTHETIESSASLLLTIAHLNTNGIQMIMPHLMDFAAMYGVDLPSAARMAAAAIEGGRNGFMRYGINIKEAHDPTSRFNMLMEALTANVGGFSDAMAKTTSGQITIFKNQVDEAKESVGGFLAYFATGYKGWGEGFIGGLKQVGDAFRLFWAEMTDISHLRDPFGPTSTWRKWENEAKLAAERITNLQFYLASQSGGSSFAPGKKDSTDPNKYIPDMTALQKPWNDFFAIQGQVSDGFEAYAKACLEAEEASQKLAEDGIKVLQKPWNDFFANQFPKAGDDFEKFAKECLEAEKAAEKLRKEVVERLGQGISEIGNTIGGALVTGDWQSVFQSISAALTDLIVKYAIAAAAAAAIKQDWGMVALWLGIAGVAAIGGGALNAALGGGGGDYGEDNFPHYASGGIVTRPTLAIVGESGPEEIRPLGSGASGVTINVYGGMWQTDDLARKIVNAIGRW
jgi:hypothetical protein